MLTDEEIMSVETIVGEWCPGKTREFQNMRPIDILTALNEWNAQKRNGWKFDWWGVPETRSAEQVVKKLWIARVDGVLASDIKELKEKTLDQNGKVPSRVFVIDCRDIREPEEGEVKRVTRTQYGWERMAIGESKTIPAMAHNLRNSLIRCCFTHRKRYVFRCERVVRFPHLGAWADMWHVTRTQ